MGRLLTTGLKLGEALGLQWSDLDLDRAELGVRRSLVRPPHGTNWLLEEPETEKSRRAVSLIPVTVAAPGFTGTDRPVERLVAGDACAPHGFVFATDRGRPLQGTVVFKYHWRPMLRRLGLPPVRLHDCRHSAATMWLEAGLPMKSVQELLGRARFTLTSDTYNHVLDGFRRQAAGALAAHLEQASTKQGQSESSQS